MLMRSVLADESDFSVGVEYFMITNEKPDDKPISSGKPPKSARSVAKPDKVCNKTMLKGKNVLVIGGDSDTKLQSTSQIIEGVLSGFGA